MSDIADMADEKIEAQSAAAINAARHAKLDAEATGCCLNCGEKMHLDNQRWCNRECQSDWNARRKRV